MLLATPGLFATTRPDDASAWGARLRMGAPLRWRPLYRAFELDISGAEPTGLLARAAAALDAHAGDAEIMLSAELAGGGRMYSWMEHAEVTTGNSVLEAHGRIDWCVTPHMTFGASLGTSPIDADDRMFTVLRAHTHSS